MLSLLTHKMSFHMQVFVSNYLNHVYVLYNLLLLQHDQLLQHSLHAYKYYASVCTSVSSSGCCCTLKEALFYVQALQFSHLHFCSQTTLSDCLCCVCVIVSCKYTVRVSSVRIILVILFFADFSCTLGMVMSQQTEVRHDTG